MLIRIHSFVKHAREASTPIRAAWWKWDRGNGFGRRALLRRAAACLILLATWAPPALEAQSDDPVAAELFWESVRSCENIGEIRLYLLGWPKGRHAAEAAECIAWDGAKGCNKKEPVERFLENFPESEHAKEARTCLARLAAKERRSVLVERLLTECRAHHEAGRLTAGSGGNALDCYRRVLDEDPGNAVALKGIAAVEQHYVRKAEAALERERPDSAERSVARLEAINPEHPQIETLKARAADLKEALAERERLEVEGRELRRKVEALLARGKPREARKLLVAGLKRGLSDKALDALERKVGEAEAELARELAEKVAGVRALLGKGRVAEARKLLATARERGLDEETRRALEAAIREADARLKAAARAARVNRLMGKCTEHGQARRLEAALACYREVLALASGHAKAAAGVDRIKPLVAWRAASDTATVEAYYRFEQEYIGSMFAKLARHRLEQMEEAYWKATQQAGTPEAYRGYLEIYPDGRFAERAKQQASRQQ